VAGWAPGAIRPQAGFEQPMRAAAPCQPLRPTLSNRVNRLEGSDLNHLPVVVVVTLTGLPSGVVTMMFGVVIGAFGSTGGGPLCQCL